MAAEGAARCLLCAQQLQPPPPCFSASLDTLPSPLPCLSLAGIVTNADFDSAVLRAVAGIEKKRSVLQVRR